MSVLLNPDQLDELEIVFRKFDRNGDGVISRSELGEMLDRINYHLSGDRQRDIEILMRQADMNADGQIQWAEFKSNALKPSDWGLSNYDFRGLIQIVARFHAKDVQTLERLKRYKWWPPPVFMIIISIVQLGVFLHYSEEECNSEASLECPKSFSSKLAYRYCCRDQPWRFVSYALVHAGWGHLLFNLLVQLLFGVYLEIIHGPVRLFGVYLMGALAGSMTSSVSDPTANVVGGSGAVYALIGAWVAHMIQNWDTGESPIKEVAAIFLFTIVSLDFGNSVYQRYNSDGTGVSYSAHLGGFLMGATFGTYMLRNIRQTWYEIYVKWFGISTAITGIFFGILFNIFSDPDEPDRCNDPALAKC